MNISAPRRRGRIVGTSEEPDAAEEPSAAPSDSASKPDPSLHLFGSKTGRKPFRQSKLRNSYSNAAEEDASKDANDDDGPVVIRPNISRLSSGKLKKKIPKSKLSFATETGDPEDGTTDGAQSLGKKKSTAKRGVVLRGLPSRLQQDDDRPKYSKENLNELRSSTPNTPRDLASLHANDADGMELDASELEGALIVESPATQSLEPGTRILSEAEIRERKERRSRLAKEIDFLSVEDDDDDEFGRKKKKESSRLQTEEDDLGEGFDDFVEDGGLSLGRRAEKERRKRDRQQMAELISAAEGNSSDTSSDSDAERRIAYESAQTRAGLDGLKKPVKTDREELPQVPPKITPLPSLAECLSRLQTSIKDMERDMSSKNARVEQLRKEKDEVEAREKELQALLDEAGRKYKAAMGGGRGDGMAGLAAEVVGERGLESLGTTPGLSADSEDVDMG
ncbi:nineteen complex-related protein 2 domain-containing protein [Ophiocordyceps camponoti-floridani]|uniref:Nineteen complex-related protein 2 domain-containing protein n=1 Tax=Ophiocordyceps camponoti-floridani TaxID=2030778 RepID=A0A8H4QAW2_9HYPO|nr:nineteen complex-related protein 2 domain-containing protein [Ophiocordyceps camponoti-floridani]